MAYDEGAAQRMREHLADRFQLAEKKMFGGIAFMVAGHMCCGVIGEKLMARVGPEHYQLALARPHARPMDFTGKPLRGFVYVEPEGYQHDRDLERWLDECVRFVTTLPARS